MLGSGEIDRKSRAGEVAPQAALGGFNVPSVLELSTTSNSVTITNSAADYSARYADGTKPSIRMAALNRGSICASNSADNAPSE